jgi:inorganic pyrophosphatase
LHFRDINELPRHTLFELQQFFEDYKKLEHKSVRIERFKGCADAQEILMRSLQLYRESYDSAGAKRPDAPVLQSEMLRSEAAKSTTEEGGEETSRTPSLSARVEAARRAAERLSRNGDSESNGA